MNQFRRLGRCSLHLQAWGFPVVALSMAMVWVPGSAARPLAQERGHAQWSTYLGGQDSAQYSSLDRIDKSNVGRLEAVWSYSTADKQAYRFNPIVVDGTMYVAAKNQSVVALDAATGKELWVHSFGSDADSEKQAQLVQLAELSGMGDGEGGSTQRGINYWESPDRSERRLFTLVGGELAAIDARTGKAVTTFGQNGRVDLREGLERPNARPISNSNPGRIFENLVIIALHGGGNGAYADAPGNVVAYDARSGKRVWVFHSIPHPGEFGYETWPKDFWRTSGGVSNWNAFSIDEKRGIVFIPFSGGGFDFYGGDRWGDNLFGTSLVALDARTGKRLWHYQILRHEIWDWDPPTEPQLLTVRHDGKNVDVVAQPTKHGLLFVFNRESGQPLWPIEEVPQPPSDVPGEKLPETQPWLTKPPPYARMTFTEADINPFLPQDEQESIRQRFRNLRPMGPFTPPSTDREVFQMPGNDGSANVNSTAVDPANGMMYIVTKEMPTSIMPLRRPSSVRPPRLPEPSPKTSNPAFIPFSSPYDALLSPSTGLSMINPPWSRLVAVDLNKGTIKWAVPNGGVWELEAQGHTNTGAHAPRGGPVVTAGGLVFAATASDRKVRAYDRDTGKVLWERELAQGSEGVPAVYEVGGREYIVFCVAAGDGYLPVKIPSKKPPVPETGSYVAFALPADTK